MNLKIEKLQKKIKNLKKRNKKIVLCHGVFDLVHLGHLKHFKSAKSFGDYLIVSITGNRHIKKGPGRPIFNQHSYFDENNPRQITVHAKNFKKGFPRSKYS